MATWSKSAAMPITGAEKVTEIWFGPRILVATVLLPERKESPVEECKAGSIKRPIVYATSTAEKAVPSEKRTPGRNLKVISRPSFEVFQDSASSGSNAWVCRLARISTPPVR